MRVVPVALTLALATPALAFHEPVTERLITMVEHDAALKGLLVASIEQAKQVNPDRRSNPAQTLEEYYAFIDWAAKAMPWSILSGQEGVSLYDRIDQSLDYFYFVNDQPLEALKGRGYYRNSLQYHEPYRSWLIQFAKEWGVFLSMRASWNDVYLAEAMADERFGLGKGWYEDPSHWTSFNDFFARYLASPDQRPIASPDDPSVVVSPADAKPQGVWKINDDSQIVLAEGVDIKSNTFTSIKALIGAESPYAEVFAGGTLTHTFLDVNDYHRYHFPVGGVIKEVRIIPADDAVGGALSWDSKKKKYLLDADTPGWQNIETRGCVILDNGKYGLVALLPVGMSQISSVNFEERAVTGATVNKDMLGHFPFGGSDVVMLFQKQVDFKLTVPREGKGYRHLLMGERYGKLSTR